MDTALDNFGSVKSDLVCDFCVDKDRRPAWLYHTAGFTAQTPLGALVQSRRQWMACETCHVLIEKHDYAGLVERATKTFIEYHPQYKKAVKGATREIADLVEARVKLRIEGTHALFHDNRVGEAMPI